MSKRKEEPDQKHIHCDLPMKDGQGRAEWDVYYVKMCQVCRYWHTSMIPVSESDRR